MFKDSKINLINDSSGNFSNSLDINNNSQNGYFVYKVFEDGKITKIFQNSVKKGALQNGITKEEIETELENFIKEFNKYNINWIKTSGSPSQSRTGTPMEHDFESYASTNSAIEPHILK